MAGWLSTLLKPFGGKSNEGDSRPGPWHVHFPDGWLPNSEGQYWNYWQMDFDPRRGSGLSAVVEACVGAYAQTIAQCPGDHWIATGDGGRKRVTTSALSRILRRPNDYQTRSDFILNLVRNLYLDGNTYAMASRNDRFEVAALHPFDPKQSRPVVAEGEQIFYELGGNNVLDPPGPLGFAGYDPYAISLGGYSGLGSPGRRIAPARDVLHVKLEAKRGEPLIGVPPLRHAGAAIAAQNALGKQLIQTFSDMNRPAGVIETDQTPSPEQMKDFRKRFNEAWRENGPPLLSHGFKWKAVSMTAEDAQLAQVAKLTWDEIFMVYGVPPAILGMTDRSSFSSTEALMQFWLARGLGFAINHIETAFDHFFGLKGWPDEYVEFDTSALLRADFKTRIEGLARGVQTAIFTPNEARRSEDLPDKEGGNEPRVQQQQVPLDWGGFDTPPEPPAKPTPPAPADGAAEDEDDGEKSLVEFFDRAEADHAKRQAA